jgi:TnpA family transposase
MKNMKSNLDNSSDRRLKILSSSEQENLYGIPRFNARERRHYFNLNNIEKDIFDTELKGNTSKIHFVLLLGYFKASYQFFYFTISLIREDAEYVASKYLPTADIDTIDDELGKRARLNHYSHILKLFSFRFATNKDRLNMTQKAAATIFIDANPKYLFKELVRFAHDQKFVLSSYTTMQDIISVAIVTQEKQLLSALNSLIDNDLKDKINKLLKKESETRYQLTLIKRPIQNFSHKQASKERCHRDELKDIFTKAKLIFRHIKISNLSIKYFAQLVDMYTIDQLKQFDETKQYFYILCFVYYRYLKINDDLIKTFLYFVGKYKGEVKLAVQEKIAQMRLENSQNFSKGAKIFRLITDTDISDDQLVKELRDDAYAILPKKKIKKLAKHMQKNDVDFEAFRWLEYDGKHNKVQTNLRHIFKSLDFTTNTKKNVIPLFEAVTYLQDHFNSRLRKLDEAPTDFIPKHLKKYLQETDETNSLNKARYETLVYRMLKNKIDSSDIFVPDSLEYRSLENDLLDANYFIKNMNEICTKLGTEFLTQNLETRVETKLKELDHLVHEVNQNILNNKNPYFKTKDKSPKWHLEYQGVENKDINNPIFKKIPKIELANLIWLVHKKCNFLSAFTHILNKNASSQIETTYLIAVIIAYATNMGLSKMASCSGLSYKQLKKTSDTFFRYETLKLASEMILNVSAQLPIHTVYTIRDKIHSSIDGKKDEAHNNIFNARYSQKYFGMKKGISTITLGANFHPLSLKVVSPNEYEGNFGLELLLMNESDIQPKVNSTDMHGINDINYALYDGCGYEFRPRYSNIYKHAQSIYSPESPSSYPNNYIVKPTHQIKKQLIFDEANNIKRIIASILSKTCTVSTIVKKLSSSMKSNETRKAIAEYNKIPRTIHILRTINELSYRQDIQVALNRGESYHQLVDAIRFVNGGRITAKTEQEQIIFKESARLVANIIIYYNSFILSEFYTQKLKQGQQKQIDALKRVSPNAWTNINFIGKYDLNNITSSTSINKLVDMIKNETLIDEILNEQDFDEF